MYSELTESNLSSQENEVSRPQSFEGEKKKKCFWKELNISSGTSAWSCGQPSTGMDSRNLSLASLGCQGFGRVIKSCIFFSGWETIVQFSTLKKISVCIYGELTTCSLPFADTIIEKNSPPWCLFLISLLHPTDLQTRSETASGLIQPQSSGSNLLVTLITFLTASFVFPEHEWW